MHTATPSQPDRSVDTVDPYDIPLDTVDPYDIPLDPADATQCDSYQ